MKSNNGKSKFGIFSHSLAARQIKTFTGEGTCFEKETPIAAESTTIAKG